MPTIIKATLALLMLGAPSTSMHETKMGPGDIPMGTFCRVQDVCVIAQTDADCGKLSGQTFDTLEACTGAASAAPQQSQ